MQNEIPSLEQAMEAMRTEFQAQLEKQREEFERKTASLQSELEQVRAKEAVDDEWLEATQSRNHGNCELPEGFREFFNSDSIKNRKETKTVYRVLSDYPEPKGGWLKPQTMDSYTVNEEYKNFEDKHLMEAQRFLLNGIKPSIAIEFICNDESKSDGAKIEDIRRINADSVRLHLHFAQEVRILRRIQAARRFQLAAKSDSHFTIGSTDDSLVFGPELKRSIAEEKSLEDSRKNVTAKGKDLPRGSTKGKGSARKSKGSFSSFQSKPAYENPPKSL